MSVSGMKNYKYVQATFGKSKRLYTFKLDPSVFPICIKEFLNEIPENLKGIYLKTIDSARLIVKEDKDIETSEISFI